MDSKINVMKNEKIPKALIKLGLPAVIGMLINAIYNVVDTYFVSGIGTGAVGGASVVYPLTMLVVGFAGIFGHGAASYISRLLGDDKKDEANNTAISAVIYSLSLSVVMIAIILPLLEPILKVFGATSTIMPYAKEYAMIYILGSPFIIINITLNNIVRSEGATKVSMLAMGFGAIINIILDPIFIYTFKYGIGGAAIATIISQVLTTCLFFYYFMSKRSFLEMRVKNFKFSMIIISQMLIVGVPTFIFQLLTSFSMGLINVKAAFFSDEAVAAMGIVTKLFSIGLYFVFGYTKGFQPFVGYNYGAKNMGRVKQAISFSVKITTIFCLIISFGFIVFSKQIINLFSYDLKVVEIGVRGLIANSIFFVSFGYQMIYVTLFLALGKAKEGTILSLCRQGICLLPILFILPNIIGLDGVLFAQGISDFLTTIITTVFVIKFYRNLKEDEIEYSNKIN